MKSRTQIPIQNLVFQKWALVAKNAPWLSAEIANFSWRVSNSPADFYGLRIFITANSERQQILSANHNHFKTEMRMKKYLLVSFRATIISMISNLPIADRSSHLRKDFLEEKWHFSSKSAPITTQGIEYSGRYTAKIFGLPRRDLSWFRGKKTPQISPISSLPRCVTGLAYGSFGILWSPKF